MLRQALPVVAVILLQTLVGIAETFYVSFLGTDALAGVVYHRGGRSPYLPLSPRFLLALNSVCGYRLR
jgi:hypothetical protein